MKKIRLLTPGPTPVPERLALRMARPIVHHRSPEFEAVFARVREGLAWLLQTRQDVLVLADVCHSHPDRRLGGQIERPVCLGRDLVRRELADGGRRDR